MTTESIPMSELCLRVLEHVVKTNGSGENGKTSMHCVEVPDITLRDYHERISKYCNVSEPCHIISLIYMDRMVLADSQMMVTKHSVHRLLITSLLLAAKFRDDEYLSTEFYSQVAGVSEDTLKRLEGIFLTSLDFSLYVARDQYEHYADCIREGTPCDGSSIVPPQSPKTLDCNRRL